jgi:hypothetical protein
MLNGEGKTKGKDGVPWRMVFSLRIMEFSRSGIRDGW